MQAQFGVVLIGWFRNCVRTRVILRSAKKTMKISKVIALIPFAMLVGLFAYIFVLYAHGDPRAQSLRLKVGEMRPAEQIFVGLTLAGLIWVWLRSLVMSFVEHRFGWFIAILFICPVTPYYIWKKE